MDSFINANVIISDLNFKVIGEGNSFIFPDIYSLKQRHYQYVLDMKRALNINYLFIIKRGIGSLIASSRVIFGLTKDGLICVFLFSEKGVELITLKEYIESRPKVFK